MQNRTTCTSMLNNRKRPNQTVSCPRAEPIGCRPGPSGAAGIPGLMPVGGFGNNQQYGNFPTSGRGAATMTRRSSNNAYNNTPVGRGYQRTFQGNNAPSSSATYQQGVRNNTAQSRNIPTGRGKTSTQPFNTMPPNYGQNLAQTYFTGPPSDGPYRSGSSSIGFGRGQGGVGQYSFNYNQPPYQPQSTVENSTRASFNGQTVNNPPRNTMRNIPLQNQQNWNRQYPVNQEIQSSNNYHYNNGGLALNYTGDTADEWNNSFSEPAPIPRQNTNNVNKDKPKSSTNAEKTALSELKKSLHLVTMDIAGVKRWTKFKDSVQLMFEVFGHLDSAVGRGSQDRKEFLIRDEKKNDISCVFYEIDRQLPKMTRGQWYRLVGTYDGRKEQFMCLSIRPLQSAERNLMQLLAQKSTEMMCTLTHNMRES